MSIIPAWLWVERDTLPHCSIARMVDDGGQEARTDFELLGHAESELVGTGIAEFAVSYVSQEIRQVPCLPV